MSREGLEERMGNSAHACMASTSQPGLTDLALETDPPLS